MYGGIMEDPVSTFFIRNKYLLKELYLESSYVC